MSAVDVALPRVATEEGYRTMKYLDQAGNETIGIGFNIGAGISRFAATALARAQLLERDQALQAYNWYRACDPVRQSVLLDMAFNTGIGGLLHYPLMLAAIPGAVASGNWQPVADQCHDKDAALDQSRYAPLRQILITGQP